LVKAALSRSSKYQQLVDTDEEKEKKPQITEITFNFLQLNKRDKSK
jgi:hypothetical protein